MPLSPLYLHALTWSQWVTDNVFYYRTLFYWDKTSFKFIQERRPRHNWPWLFINFGLCAGLAFPSVVFFFLRALFQPTTASLLNVLAGLMQSTVGIILLGTSVGYLLYASQIVSCCNQTLVLESYLFSKYFIPPQLVARRSRSSIFRLANGQFDILGAASIFLVIGFTIIAIILPCIILWLKLDVIALAHRHIFEKTPNYPDYVFTILFHGVRVLVEVLACVEVCNCFRTLVLTTFLGTTCLHSALSLLSSHSVNEVILIEFCQIRAIFEMVRDFVAFLVPVCLGMMYIHLIVCMTTILTAFSALPWHFSCLVLFIGIITVSIVIIIFYIAVGVDQAGLKLNKAWVYSCSELGASKRKFLCRKVKSLRPLRIPYGSLGTFNKATRTDYFSSLFENSINVILAIRHE